jgi:hypothetical protein
LLKKTIKFENPFTNEPVEEVHYFHISKADLVQMEMEVHGTEYTDADNKKLTGMQAKLTRIMESQDGRAIMEEIRDIIRRSYGRKEGDRFIKSQQIWDEFSSTEAYSQLIFDLCTNAAAAAEFMNGVVPHNLEKIAAEVREMAAKVEAGEDSELAETVNRLDAAQARLQSETPERPVDPTGLTEETVDGTVSDRAKVLAEASPEIPVTLTRTEMTEMDGDELQAGLASGKYRLS